MDSAPLIVLMGVAGSGKTTVGHRVADALGVEFLDADDLHDPADVERMRAGQPLDDHRRGPWLDRVHEQLQDHRTDGLVVACSALRRSYRERLTRDLPGVRFVALVASPDTLRDRLARRRDHFAGADLLESQLSALELEEDVPVVDADADLDRVTTAVLRHATSPERRL